MGKRPLTPIHVETKHQWARDDPAFLVLLASFLCGKLIFNAYIPPLPSNLTLIVSAVAWGLVFGLGIIGILRAMLFMIIVDFVCVGSIVATFTWFMTNRFLCQQQQQQVEWAYAFDIHCNSFFPLFLILYVIQFFCLKILIRSNIISLVTSNLLYLISITWYCYGTFLGFNGKIVVVVVKESHFSFFL